MLAYAASIIGIICLLIVNYFMEGDFDKETAIVSVLLDVWYHSLSPAHA